MIPHIRRPQIEKLSNGSFKEFLSGIKSYFSETVKKTLKKEAIFGTPQEKALLQAPKPLVGRTGVEPVTY